MTASEAQMSYLLEFIQANCEMVNNKKLKPGERYEDRREKWTQLANHLNSMEGKRTDYRGWQSLWKDWRFRVKRKAEEEVFNNEAGGGRKRPKPLSEQEKQIMNLMNVNLLINSSVNLPSLDLCKRTSSQAFFEEAALEWEIAAEQEASIVIKEVTLSPVSSAENDEISEEQEAITVIKEEVALSPEPDEQEVPSLFDERMLVSPPQSQLTEEVCAKATKVSVCRRRTQVPLMLAKQLIKQHEQAMENEKQSRSLQQRQTVALEKIAEAAHVICLSLPVSLWLFHEHLLLQVSVKERRLHVMLLRPDAFLGCDVQQHSHGLGPHNGHFAFTGVTPTGAFFTSHTPCFSMELISSSIAAVHRLLSGPLTASSYVFGSTLLSTAEAPCFSLILADLFTPLSIMSRSFSSLSCCSRCLISSFVALGLRCRRPSFSFCSPCSASSSRSVSCGGSGSGDSAGSRLTQRLVLPRQT